MSFININGTSCVAVFSVPTIGHRIVFVIKNFLILLKIPLIKADYEAKNLHSNEQMKSIKRVRRNQNRQTSLEQKRRDREEEIKRRNGNRRVKYMHNIEL